MNATCYFWKWADNDLPGKPLEVHAALLRGELHPALQTFDARPVLAAIEAMAGGSPPAERDEWEWLAEPANQKHAARFILLNCPRPSVARTMHEQLSRQLLRFGVTCFDEGFGMMGNWFPPKLNEFQSGQWPGDMRYDITADELPVLIKRTDPKSPNPYSILTDRRTHFVQCLAKGRRFVVEWRENYDRADFEKFDHWKAQDKKRSAVLKMPYTPTGIPAALDLDFLTYADTVRIFEAFLRGESRPAQYHWRNINAEI
ncbi:MAG: hypothetical protein ABSE16_14335 [Verrucomicrobiota bacterium]|jgi:hypothetical protein